MASEDIKDSESEGKKEGEEGRDVGIRVWKSEKAVEKERRVRRKKGRRPEEEARFSLR